MRWIDYKNYEEQRLRWFSFVETILHPDERELVDEAKAIEVPVYWMLEFVNCFPESRAKLAELIHAGKLKLSAWFIIPASINFPPEIVIRNLIYGGHFWRQMGREQNSLNIFSASNFSTQFQLEPASVASAFYSVRIQLKQQLLRGFDLLTRYVEPLNCLALLCDIQSSKCHIDRAWHYLLQNLSPEIQLGYCSDSLTEDASHRLKKVHDILEAVKKRILSELFPTQTNDADTIVIFNPGFQTRDRIVEYQLTRKINDKITPNELSMIDTDQGLPVRYQIIKIKPSPNDEKRQKISLLLDAKGIPALSFKQFKLSEATHSPKPEHSIKTGRFFLENEYMRATVLENGSLILLDKKNNQLYERLNIFEDRGDVGDTAQFISPKFNTRVLSKSFKPRISLAETGPLKGAIRIRYRMKIPNRISEDEKHRKKDKQILRIWTTISLDYNTPYLRIITRINNTIQNHRLRVRFETGIDTRYSYTRKFGVITETTHREHAFSKSSPDCNQPLHRFVSVKDEERALTVFSKDTIAYQLCLDPKRTLALTLLRSVGKLQSVDSGTESVESNTAQCQGEHVFEYALFPHTPHELDNFQFLNSQLENFSFPMLAFQTRYDAARLIQKTGISIEPAELSVLCFKEAESGRHFVLRILNPTQRVIQAQCCAAFPIETIAIISPDELIEESQLKPENGKIGFSMNPNDIVTLRITI